MIHTHIKPHQLKEPKSNNITVAMSTPRTQILISKYHFPLKKNQGSLKKITASGSGPGAGQMQVSLGNCAVPERKEILKD